MYSIIMPAFNEEKIIQKSLNSLLKDAKKNEIEIILICNGCTDKTAELAQEISGPVKVIETSIASKSNALNIGDKIALGYPRFYVDSDLIFNIADVRKVAKALTHQNILAASPKFVFDFSGSSVIVKKYYHVWEKMPYLKNGRIAGAYALSEVGRSRFGEFPDIISDDGYVRLHFTKEERITVENSKVLVKTPKTLSDLVKIKSRSFVGTKQLRKHFPMLRNNETSSVIKSLLNAYKQKVSIIDALVYGFVTFVYRLRGLILYKRLIVKWERDESSRLY